MAHETRSISSIVRRSILLVFVAAVVLGTSALYVFFKSDSEHHLKDEARILMDAATAMRVYTSQHISPLLMDNQSEFRPEAVPSFSAQQVFRLLVTEEDGHSYREASLNPTNPADLATPREAELIAYFQRDESLTELSGTREQNGQNLFYFARPIRLTDPNCLSCHSTPDAAPAAMIERYGPNGGFGWALGDVVAIQHVTVPIHAEIRSMLEVLSIFVGILVLTFIVVAAAVLAPLHAQVIQPLSDLARDADRNSRRNEPLALSEKGAAEINTLSAAINRLRTSLSKALQNGSPD